MSNPIFVLMKQKNLFVLVLLVFMFSCKNSKEVKLEEELTSKVKYQNIKDEVVEIDTLLSVELIYKDSVIGWKGYAEVEKDLQLLKKCSPNEVLNLSQKLVNDVVLMKDSIHVVSLNEKGIRVRMNTLYNQALRLQEMKDIPAITVQEIVKQTQSVFTLHNMINDKINAIYEQKKFEKELSENQFFFSKLDSIE